MAGGVGGVGGVTQVTEGLTFGGEGGALGLGAGAGVHGIDVGDVAVRPLEGLRLAGMGRESVALIFQHGVALRS